MIVEVNGTTKLKFHEIFKQENVLFRGDFFIDQTNQTIH